MSQPSRTGDQNLFVLEMKIAKMLRYGVIIAGALMVAGWIPRINFHGNPLANFREYRAQPFLAAFFQACGAYDLPTILSDVGLMALIALPFLRVLMTAILFFKRKDFALAGIAAFVLVILIASCTLGLEL